MISQLGRGAARPTPPHGTAGRPVPSDATLDAFRRLKPTCVALMGLASQPPTLFSRHAQLLTDLLQMLETIPASAFTPSLINYTLFPLTSALRHSDPSSLPGRFLEAAFGVLALIIRAWRGVDGGVDVGAWEQLWRFTTAVLGRGGAKGKGREMDDEVVLAAVRLLAALLEPADGAGKTSLHPNAAMLRLTMGRTAPLLPTLFQTISTLLAIAAPAPAHLELGLSTLRLLRALVPTYLKGQPELLASILPGTVSAVAKLVAQAGGALKSDVAREAAGLVEVVVVETLDDDALRSLGILRPAYDDLGQFAEWDGAEPAIPADSNTTDPRSPSASNDPFPPLTASYLAFTSTQLLKTLPPILTALASHAVHTARTAAASLAFALLAHCRQSLPDLVAPAMSTLLLLSTDTFDAVRHDARRRLGLLLSSEAERYDLYPSLVSVLTTSINALPRLIMSQQDDKVVLCARTIEAISAATRDLADAADAPDNVIAAFLGPAGAVERWGWALLDCLELGRPTGWSTVGSVVQAAARGWTDQLVTSAVPLLGDADAEGAGASAHAPAASAAFPFLPLRHVESAATVRVLESMLAALGAAGGEPALHTVDHFMRFARANCRRQVAKAVSAVWVAGRLLAGIAEGQAAKGCRVGRATRKMARDVAKIVVAVDDDYGDDDDDDDDGLPAEPDETSDALLPIERKQGIDALTTMLDRKLPTSSSAAAQTRRLHAQAQRSLLGAVSLSTLATASGVLGHAFRPLLLTALYAVLAHLASPAELVRACAATALARLAHDCGYATPRDLVLDNVDYVVNAVSQRLTHRRLSAHAPLVLVAMVRLVGDDIVPLVHDVVDDIFDALDDYHGYEALASALLAVLATLIDVMAAAVEAEGLSEERKRKMEESSRIAPPPEPATDFARLAVWFEERGARSRQDLEDVLARAPQRAWGAADGGEDMDVDADASAADDAARPANASDDAEPAPTRTQAVCRLILSKSLFFLTHGSPFLRARVLALAARAAAVLAAGGRDADLLALVDRHWPALLARLDDASPPVAAAAADAVAALCEHVGDFMARRVLDHAWPKLKALLARQADADRRSALARRPVGATAAAPLGTDSPHTASHRLRTAALRAAAAAARAVPVPDAVLWDMALTCRFYLDVRAHAETQRRAGELFAALARRDADAVWVVMRATDGSLEGDRAWAHLREPALDMGANAEAILAML